MHWQRCKSNEVQPLLDNPLSIDEYLYRDNLQGCQLHERQWQRNLLEAGVALLGCLQFKLESGPRLDYLYGTNFCTALPFLPAAQVAEQIGDVFPAQILRLFAPRRSRQVFLSSATV